MSVSRIADRAGARGDEERAATVALLALPGVGSYRYRVLVEASGSAVVAWERVRAGVDPDLELRSSGSRRETLVTGWRRAARGCDPVELLARHRELGVTVLLPGDADWPAALDEDPEPPAALFVRGDVGLLDTAAVAVIGTRRATAFGLRVAHELGRALAAAGVSVVSGLALGIDGAAHRGVLAAGGRPVGVVGTGLDVVYPPRHRGLWADVAAAGVLCSEWPLGAAADRWRFPARNRVIAALCRRLVVVESGERGGSMHTVEAALARNRPVMAVPGSVVVEASAGTNRLLHEGAELARDARDVLVALDLGDPALVCAEPAPVAAPAPPPGTRAVDALLSSTPVGLDELAAAAGRPVLEVATVLARLEAAGRVVRDAAGYQRVLP